MTDIPVHLDPETDNRTLPAEPATEIDYAARVARGVALLDERRPGWRNEIDPVMLDIGSPTHCVSAQLSGSHDFEDGMRQLGLTPGNDGTYTAHGFEAIMWHQPHGLGPDYNAWAQTTAYATLTRLWLLEVTRGPELLQGAPAPA